MPLPHLLEAWTAADTAARNAETKIRQAITAQINDTGRGPTQSLYDAATRLRAIANERLARLQAASERLQSDHSAPGELMDS